MGVVCFVGSCEKDDQLELPNNLSQKNVDVQVNKYTLTSLSKQEKFTKAFEKVFVKTPRQLGRLQKTIMEETYGFTIDSSLIKEVVSGGYTSYTFLIHRDSIISDNYFENLVISIDSVDNIAANIIKYTPNTPSEHVEGHDSYSFDAEMELKSIEFNNSQAKMTAECYRLTITYCNNPCSAEGDCSGQATHIAGPNCTNHQYMWTESYRICEDDGMGYDDGGGGGGIDSGSDPTDPGSPSGGGGGTPGGNTGDNNSDDNTAPGNTGCRGCGDDGGSIITAPILDEEIEEDEELEQGDPCEELKKFTKDPLALEAFNNLKNSLNANEEKGYKVRAISTEPFFTTIFQTSDDECKEIPFGPNPLVFALMHTHPTGCGQGTHPMFGHGDLLSLYATYNNFTDLSSIDYNISTFAVYMTVSDNHYAIKIKDLNKLEHLGAVLSNSKKKKSFRRQLENLYDHASSTSYNTSPNQHDLTKALLKFIKQNDLGISVYKTSHEDLNNKANGGWKELFLNNAGTTVMDEPCAE